MEIVHVFFNGMMALLFVGAIWCIYMLSVTVPGFMYGIVGIISFIIISGVLITFIQDRR